MRRTLLNSKIHRATVTGANLHYVGSIAIDAQLMKDSNILPFEKVEIVNVNNGLRWETYAIEAEPGTGTVEVRGGGARLAQVGDIVIIMTYVEIEEPIPAPWEPCLVMLNKKNQISEILKMDKRGLALH
jgi:aspartate 1-decarboxylase